MLREETMENWIAERQRLRQIEKSNLEDEINDFMSKNGVVNLGYADKKVVEKCQRLGYHMLKQYDNERSAKIVSKQKEAESLFIFSRDDRNKKDATTSLSNQISVKNKEPEKIFIFSSNKNTKKK